MSCLFNKLCRVEIRFLYAYGRLMEENYGNQDYSISSGGVIWSGNARPIPQISFATSGHTGSIHKRFR